MARADVTMKELLALNHGIDPAKVEEAQTILLPAGRLSSRDREILQGALAHTQALVVRHRACPLEPPPDAGTLAALSRRWRSPGLWLQEPSGRAAERTRLARGARRSSAEGCLLPVLQKNTPKSTC